jgi:hypothetical protein
MSDLPLEFFSDPEPSGLGKIIPDLGSDQGQRFQILPETDTQNKITNFQQVVSVLILYWTTGLDTAFKGFLQYS